MLSKDKEVSKARLNLTVDKEIIKKAKVYCVENDISLSQFIEDHLRKVLEKYEKKQKK